MNPDRVLPPSPAEPATESEVPTLGVNSALDLEERRKEILAIWLSSSDPMSVSLISAVEDSYILTDAMQSYRFGADTAAIICAHASCERDLLARVMNSADGSEPPKRSEMWGLGKLISHFDEILPPGLIVRLQDVNEMRKTLYHYGHETSENAISYRTHQYIDAVGQSELFALFEETYLRRADFKDLLQFAMIKTLRKEAVTAISTALETRAWSVHGGSGTTLLG